MKSDATSVLSLTNSRFEIDLLLWKADGMYVFALSAQKFYQLDDEVRSLVALLDATDSRVLVEGVGMRCDYALSSAITYDLRPAYLAKKNQEVSP